MYEIIRDEIDRLELIYDMYVWLERVEAIKHGDMRPGRRLVTGYTLQSTFWIHQEIEFLKDLIKHDK